MSKKKKRSEALATESPARAFLPWQACGAVFASWAFLIFWTYSKRGIKLSGRDWLAFMDLNLYIPKVLAEGLFFDLCFAGAVWFLFYVIGSEILRALRVPPVSRGERIALSTGIGAGTLSLLLLVLGLAHLWNPGFLSILFCLGVIGGAARLYYRDPGPDDESLPAGERRGPFEWTAIALTLSAVVMGILATTTPEIFYDSLIYHLALPKLFLLRGAIVPTPENIYSGLPLGVQMIFGLGLALSDENLSALLHLAFGIGTAFSLWAWLRKWAADSTGILAVMIFMLTPIALYASWHCGVDLGSCFYVMTALMALSRAVQDPSEPEKSDVRPVWAIATGLLVGFAMGTKFNVIPIGGAFVGVHWFLCRRAGRPYQETIWLWGVAAAVFLPWLIKNAFFYGNPLYPFLFDKIGWASPAHWKAFLGAAGGRTYAETFANWDTTKHFIFHPWYMSTGSWPLGDWPGPAFISLTPWAFFVGWGLRKEVKEVPRSWTALILLVIGGYGAWAGASKLVRYLLPVLPLIAAVTALAVDRSGYPNRLRRAGWALAIISVAFNFQAAFRQGWGIGQWEVLRGIQSRYQYLTEQRVTYGLPYYAAMEWIDKNLPLDAKVLFLGESRAFYCERDFVAASIYDYNPFWVAAETAKTPAALREWLRKEGITHIFQSARQMHFRHDSPAIMPRETVERSQFMEFWATYTDLLWEDRDDGGDNPRWLGVYSLRSKPKTDPETFSKNPARFVLEVLKRQQK